MEGKRSDCREHMWERCREVEVKAGDGSGVDRVETQLES